ncbi:SPOR domain-containing protein [Pseudobdellovibrio sp. HCB154]|uniref:SPOR domain-containing protein n=1 Tax=Pseudobdellovibrio sp. HCB154 TaxID=3386277 RepID=UPI0039175A45
MTMNTNRIIELALVFFISLFSFSIGTFVGKKYSDNQHRLALLEPNKKTEERQTIENAAHTEGAATTTASEGEITDADVAKMAEEFSAEGEETHGETTAATTGHGEAATVAEHGTKTIKTIKPEVKDVKEVTLAEADGETPEREVASIPAKAKTMATYTVQVGSYPSEAEANKMTESLVARGYKANAVPANVNGKTMYRVQVGLFNNLNEAQEYKKELMEKNRLTSAFVQKVAK